MNAPNLTAAALLETAHAALARARLEADFAQSLMQAADFRRRAAGLAKTQPKKKHHAKN